MDSDPVVVDEDAKSRQAEDGGCRQELPALDSGAQADLGSPGGEGEQTQSEQPAHVEKRPGHVCVCRNPEEVERVCDGEAGEPGGDQHPLAAGPPAGHREHSDDEGKQHHVAERVCEVGRDGKAVATRGLDDRSERYRRSNRSDAESADCTVEPGRMAHAGKSGTGEKKNSSVGRKIEEEPKRIGDRGIRHRIPEPENGRVVGVPQRPKKSRRTDAEPCQSICAAKGPDEDERRSDQQDCVVEHSIEPQADELCACVPDLSTHHHHGGAENDKEQANPAHKGDGHTTVIGTRPVFIDIREASWTRREGANICSMATQGSALTRYRRAIETESVVLAELAAREMGRVPLVDALQLVKLYASAGSPKAEPAAVRWLARLALERPRTTIGELQLAAAALDQLSERPKTAARTLLDLAT